MAFANFHSQEAKKIFAHDFLLKRPTKKGSGGFFLWPREFHDAGCSKSCVGELTSDTSIFKKRTMPCDKI